MAAQPDPESKTLQIWDREVHYRLEIRQDPSLSFDGEARQEKGSSQFKVLLNTAFLRPEADQIFVALLQANNLPPAGIPNEKDGLKKIEKALLSGRKISANSVRYLD